MAVYMYGVLRAWNIFEKFKSSSRNKFRWMESFHVKISRNSAKTPGNTNIFRNTQNFSGLIMIRTPEGASVEIIDIKKLVRDLRFTPIYTPPTPT